MNLTNRTLPAAIICMGLLAGSKALNLLHHIEIGAPAHANPTQAEAKPTSATTPQPSAHTCPPPTEKAAAEQPVSESERALLQDLRKRRGELDARASKLDEREAILSAAETQFNDRIQQLTALQTKLEDLDKQRRAREEANWTGLVKTYEVMKPRDAAAIFDDLDNTILVQVLDRMKDRNAAAILAAMTPERARAATKMLAQWRNQVTATPKADPAGGPSK